MIESRPRCTVSSCDCRQREAGLMLCNWFDLPESEKAADKTCREPDRKKPEQPKAAAETKGKAAEPDGNAPNKPLGFELQSEPRQRLRHRRA